MSKYTPAELAEAREDYVREQLSQRCDIRRSEPGIPDGYGGRSQRFSLAYRDVPCRAQNPSRAQATEEGYRNTALSDWEILLPVGTDVRPSDLIEVAGVSSYEVVGSNAGIEDALVLIAYCARKT